MAKTSKLGDQNGKVKFRIIEFELEGSHESLNESLKNLAAAFARPSAALPSRPLKSDLSRQLHSADSTLPMSDDDLVAVENVEETTEHESQAVKRGSSPRKTKIAPVKILADIRLDDVSPTLKEFCAEKTPTTDISRYLVIAYWFKNFKEIPDLTPDHFYTAYRLLNWSAPRDPAQPIRDLRHNRRGKFSRGSTSGTSTINHIGENTVIEMDKS
jgi:hypothetical protein